MAKKRKKTRKELLKEPDEFITLSGKLIRFAVEHKTALTYAVAIIIGLAVIISGIRFFSIRGENKAAALLDKSLTKYESLKNEKKSPQESYSAVSSDFQLILSKYSSKESGKIARLTFANICYNAGNYEQAIELYKTSLEDFEKHPLIHNQVLGSLGYAWEQLNDYATAVVYFEKLAASPEPIMRAEALYHLGWLYDKLGQTDKSQAAYNKILSDHPDFIYLDLVKERMTG
ncbi:MAG: tetratricopeptide repeat protein [Desulfobacterales bacterium]|nr:MAG: tetratricopeptide repeat protein [Desulfobacterales bacterium]